MREFGLSNIFTELQIGLMTLQGAKKKKKICHDYHSGRFSLSYRLSHSLKIDQIQELSQERVQAAAYTCFSIRPFGKEITQIMQKVCLSALP